MNALFLPLMLLGALSAYRQAREPGCCRVLVVLALVYAASPVIALWGALCGRVRP